MELPATIARWDGDQLTVWDKVQGIGWRQRGLLEGVRHPHRPNPHHLTFRRRRVRLAGKTWPNGFLAAFAARQLRRPVKLVLTRKQFYSVVGYRPTSRQRMAIGADRTGRITAIVHEARVENSRYDGYEDNRDRAATLSLQLAQHALDVPHGPARRQPTDLHARPRRHQWRVRPRVRHGRPRLPPRHGSRRAPTAQRTRPRPVRGPAVLDPPTDRLLPPGRATPSAGRDATPRPAPPAKAISSSAWVRPQRVTTPSARHARCQRASTPTAPPTSRPPPATWARAPTHP